MVERAGADDGPKKEWYMHAQGAAAMGVANTVGSITLVAVVARKRSLDGANMSVEVWSDMVRLSRRLGDTPTRCSSSSCVNRPTRDVFG